MERARPDGESPAGPDGAAEPGGPGTPAREADAPGDRVAREIAAIARAWLADERTAERRRLDTGPLLRR